MKKPTSPLDYVYQIGRIRALERFLIKGEVFQEATDASLEDALRLFAESDLYTDEILRAIDSHRLEIVLDKELLKLKELVKGLLLDKALIFLVEFDDLNKMKAICKNINSRFLLDYIMHVIDMHNIKTFLRLYILKEPKSKLETGLVDGGFVKKGIFLKLYEQDLAAFLNQMEYVNKHGEIINYASFLEEAIEKIERENSFVFLEKVIYNLLIQALRPAKYLTFGPEPIVAYYFAKKNEINLIRMIILSKLNNLPKDFVKEGLNTVYA